MTIEAETVLFGSEQDKRFDTILKIQMKRSNRDGQDRETRRLEIEEHDARKEVVSVSCLNHYLSQRNILELAQGPPSKSGQGKI